MKVDMLLNLTAAEADKVSAFLAAARALPRSIAVQVEDGELIVWKRIRDQPGRMVQADKLKKKSLDHWE